MGGLSNRRLWEDIRLQRWLRKLASRLVCGQEGMVLSAREQGLSHWGRLRVEGVKFCFCVLAVPCAGHRAIFRRISPVEDTCFALRGVYAGHCAIFGYTRPKVWRSREC